MSIWKTIGDSNFIKFLKWAVAQPFPKVEKIESDDDWREGTVWKSKEESENEPERARDKKGQYQGDDESTSDVNEAWVGGKSPKNK
jgi:hypothetical protein